MAAVAQLLLSAGHAAVDRYLLPVGPTAANPQQQRAAARLDTRTDGRTPDRFIDTALHIGLLSGQRQQLNLSERCDTRWYFNVRSKAGTSQLNLPHGTEN